MELDPDELANAMEEFNGFFIRLPAVQQLSFTTLSVLHTLSRRSPLRLGELTAIEQVTQSAITQLVTRLERDGLVERRPDPRDGRGVLVHITGAGRAVVAARPRRPGRPASADPGPADRAGACRGRRRTARIPPHRRARGLDKRHGRYAAGGCDVGALVTGQLGHKYADELYGIHIGSGLKLSFFNGDRAWDLSGGRPIPDRLAGDVRAQVVSFEKKFAVHLAAQVLAPDTLGFGSSGTRTRRG